MDDVWTIVGLGNPGAEYHSTRHNVGFWAIATLERSLRIASMKSHSGCNYAQTMIDGRKVFLVTPQQYMNRSGSALRPLMDYFKLSATTLVVVHDELDLEPGVLRLRLGGSAAGHNGLKDIIQHLGTDQFYRVRVGIGHPRTREDIRGDDVSDYVLGTPRSAELTVLEEAAERAGAAASMLITDGLTVAQRQFHPTAK